MGDEEAAKKDRAKRERKKEERQKKKREKKRRKKEKKSKKKKRKRKDSSSSSSSSSSGSDSEDFEAKVKAAMKKQTEEAILQRDGRHGRQQADVRGRDGGLLQEAPEDGGPHVRLSRQRLDSEIMVIGLVNFMFLSCACPLMQG